MLFMRFSIFRKISAAAFLAAMAAMLAPVPASAQFSDTYNFLRGVRNRDFEEVRQIVEQPGSTVINVRDRSSGEGALHIVTRERDTQWLLYLLRNHANPNIRDNDGNTPMHIAAQIGYGEAVRWLNVVNADVNARNDRGETPLVLAVQQRNAAIVRQLVEAGANPDIADSVVGLSARDYAVRDGRSQHIVEILDSAQQSDEQAPVVGPTPN
jgi:ankyrin repeat protein